MSDLRESIRKEFEELVADGRRLLAGIAAEARARSKTGTSERAFSAAEYQPWYTRSLLLVRQILPERSAEFEELYEWQSQRDEPSVKDYLLGATHVWMVNQAMRKLEQQVAIVESARSRLDSILCDIRGVLRADLFDNELDSASSLLQAKHLRAAGTVAGVVLEGHLSTVCSNHGISLRKRNPTISDYNESLKSAGVLDVPNWRWIQRLGDIRNLCSHARERDPTSDEVEELIDGVEKAIKTLF